MGAKADIGKEKNALPVFQRQHASLVSEYGMVMSRNIEILLRIQHLDIAKLSRMTSISRPTLYKILAGKTNVLFSQIEKIAAALGVSLPELLQPQYGERAASAQLLR